MTYRCCALPLDPMAIAHYRQQLGVASLDEALLHLAQAIALHPMWQELSQGLCIVRAQPTPLLAILGIFSPKLWEQIQLQRKHLNQACQRLRFVSYPEALQACEQLAHQLRAHFSPSTLQTLQFYGIPRGGLLVLGMLSYLLDLRHEQLNPWSANDAPLVLVDDCALSGARFRQVLKQHPNRDLVLATLYAHPDLKRAIAHQEPQVLHCLSGHDLVDHGNAVMGEDYPTWQAENIRRLAGHRYWLGLPDYLCFPWNEPDHLLWNATTAQLEQSWSIMPPSHCIKRRSATAHPLPIAVQNPGNGWLQPAPEVVFGDMGESVWIGYLPTGETYGLLGKAAVYWRVILQAPDLESAIQTLAPQYPPPSLRSELVMLIDQLMQQRILVNAPSCTPHPAPTKEDKGLSRRMHSG